MGLRCARRVRVARPQNEVGESLPIRDVAARLNMRATAPRRVQLRTPFEHGRDSILCRISRPISNPNFQAAGITTFLEKGGQLETAQRIAGHADSRTTKDYDRRATSLELSEIARVRYER